jgi:hypothetical protein
MPKPAKSTVAEESAAAATLKPNPSRASMLATFTQMLAQLGMEDLTHFFNDSIAQIGQEAANIDPNAAAKNVATIATKEDIDEVFAGEELSEEFKAKAAEIFGALVEARVVLRTAEIEEQFEEKMKDEAEAIIEQVTDTLDQYLNYVASEWLKDNEVEVEQSLRSEIAESFLEGLHTLFRENNIRVPEAKVDVLEQLTARVEQLETELDEEVNKNIELQTAIEEGARGAVFAEVSEGLVATQVEKFRTLSEGIEFADAESFKRKLGVIKEKHFSKSDSAPVSGVLTEENDVPLEEADDKKPANPAMSRYVQAISQTSGE